MPSLLCGLQGHNLYQRKPDFPLLLLFWLVSVAFSGLEKLFIVDYFLYKLNGLYWPLQV